VSNIEQAVKELQDTLVVISEIERRQSSLLKERSERIVYLERLAQESAEFRHRTEQLQQRTEQNLAEITDKLNGLIGYVDGLHKPPN
jgi:hypothetical protein